MTVEEYLKKQCEQRVDQVKRHMEGLIESFDGEAKKARTVLREVAANAGSGAADDAEGTSAGSSSERNKEDFESKRSLMADSGNNKDDDEFYERYWKSTTLDGSNGRWTCSFKSTNVIFLWSIFRFRIIVIR